jgi:hypothetical protein
VTAPGRGTRIGAALAAAALVALVPVAAAAAEREDEVASADESIGAAVRWLDRQQYDDGGFDGYGAAVATPEAVLAFAEAAQTEPTWGNRAALEGVENVESRDGRTPMDAARRLARGNEDAALAARLIVRVALPLGLDAGEDGPYGDSVALVAEGVTDEDRPLLDRIEMAIALVTVGAELPEGVLDAVAGAQQESGGWSAAGDADGDVDLPTTGAAGDLLVLAGNAPDSPPVTTALNAVAQLQGRNGTWPGADDEASVEATAGAIRAIRAAGHDPTTTCWQTDLGIAATSASPTDALIAQQGGDGHFGSEDSTVATSQAVHALSGRWLPRGRATESCGSSEGRDFPVDPALVVLGAIAVVGVGGGVRILRSAPSAY